MLQLFQQLRKIYNMKMVKSYKYKTNAQYNENDAFYEAIGSYSIFHTCNTWTNNTLRGNVTIFKMVSF